MFIVKSVNPTPIKKHLCSSLDVAMKVQKYIMEKYREEISIEEKDEPLFYSSPGFRVVYEFEYITIGVIHLRIDDLLIFCSLIESAKLENGKEFVRIPGLMVNLCISEEEYKEIQNFIEKNKEFIDSKNEQVNSWFSKSILR